MVALIFYTIFLNSVKLECIDRTNFLVFVDRGAFESNIDSFRGSTRNFSSKFELCVLSARIFGDSKVNITV
jgi:hypothetical protein